MTSAQAHEQTLEQKNKQTTAQLIKLLIAIIPNYDDDFWHAETELFGAIAEFDSMALVTLIGEMEDYFDITLDDDDISAENFASVASLTELVLERN
ncbi:acyl carrier protein [Colwellia sp. 12G3]|uniref:acyl carrier protein n=1 Tax=Colwellia sp. 12G3 TaxID=2058299 RepID=UPI000C32BF4C|nr:phosphopantetheine-binding protein [Colwellia sp. 12G3]PKI17792.1 acyl carrier protein [Colwellia sp. 12G3]